MMRNRSVALPLVALIVLCAADRTSAQSPEPAVLAGAGIATGAASVTSSIPVYRGDPGCGSYGSASTLPLIASLALRVPSAFARGIGLGARAGMALQRTELTAVPIDPQHAVDPSTGALVDVEREIRLTSQLTTLTLDLTATFEVGGFTVSAGPTVGFNATSSETTRDVIMDPSFATFRSGERERDVPDATVLTRQALAAGGVLDVSYLIGLGGRAFLAPHVELRFGALSPYADASWTQLMVGGGADVLFDLTPAPRTPAPVIVIDTASAIVPPPTPTATFTLRSIDSTGAVVDGPAEVIYRDVIERRYLPLIPAVFFDSASSAFPARVRTADADSKPSDVASVVAGLSTLEAQAHLLDIVGERLRANPSVALTIVGSTSSDEPRALARTRAETVRSYLVDVWHVESSQVSIEGDARSLRLSSEAMPEGRAENRRVELIARDPARDVTVLRPVLTERRIAHAVLPVTLLLRAQSGAPRWHWDVRIADRSGEIRRIDSSGNASARIAFAPEEITAESPALTLHATATFEQPGVPPQRSATSIPLTWRSEHTIIEGGTERTADRERTTWQLLGFAFNSPELLERHRDELRSIVPRIGDSATVIVTGYSDRLGDEARNIELSRERAQRIASALEEELARRGTSAVRIEVVGAGVDESRFSNDLPEGRFLSRGVTILAEQAAR
jgi:outer membrane protein OmpA-like peptidoglycan-associated protein